MTSTKIPLAIAVAVKGDEDSTTGSKKSSTVTLVYGLDPELDRIEIESENLRKGSSYFAGLLQQNPTKHLSIEVEYPDVFREFIIPHLLSDKEPTHTQEIWKVWKVAQDMGLVGLILQVKQLIASSLEEHIQSSDFNPSFVTKEQLYDLLMLNYICFSGEKAEDITTKRLRILLYWLREESVEDCRMMNIWFAERFNCSWILHISRSQKQLQRLQEEFPNAFDKFFTSKPETIKKYIPATKHCLKYEVKGAGKAAVNGIYQLTSVENSCPIFTRTNGKAVYQMYPKKSAKGNRCWFITAPDASTYYYIKAEEGQLPPTEGWHACGGKNPPPHVNFHFDFK